MNQSEDENIVKFLDFESDYSLCYKQVNTFFYWQYIRFDIYNNVIMKKGIQVSAKNIPQESLNRKLKIITNLLKFSRDNLSKASIESDILILNHYRRFKNEEGCFECIYTDIIKKLIDKKTVNLECFTDPAPLTPVEYQVYYNANRYLKYFFRKKFKYWYYKEAVELVNKEVEFLANAIKQYYCIVINKKYVSDLLLKYYIYRDVHYDYYFEVLKHLHTKFIFEVVHYNINTMVVNEAAHKLNLEIIEVQHGVIGEGHIAYNIKQKTDIFPDKILLFSEFWKRKSMFPLEGNCLIPIGFPYLERQEKKTTIKKSNNEEHMKILIVSQWTVTDALIELTKSICERLKETNNNNIVIEYKLHPEEIKQNYSEVSVFKQYSKYVKISDKENIYEAFIDSDIQIGVYSTSLLEGLYFGLQTYRYNVRGYDSLDFLVSGGFADSFETVDELFELLQKNEKSYNRITNELWEKHPIENLKKFLDDEIIGCEKK